MTSKLLKKNFGCIQYGVLETRLSLGKHRVGPPKKNIASALISELYTVIRNTIWTCKVLNRKSITKSIDASGHRIKLYSGCRDLVRTPFWHALKSQGRSRGRCYRPKKKNNKTKKTSWITFNNKQKHGRTKPQYHSLRPRLIRSIKAITSYYLYDSEAKKYIASSYPCSQDRPRRRISFSNRKNAKSYVRAAVRLPDEHFPDKFIQVGLVSVAVQMYLTRCTIGSFQQVHAQSSRDKNYARFMRINLLCDCDIRWKKNKLNEYAVMTSRCKNKK